MSTFTHSFLKFTAIVLVVLCVVYAGAWLYSPAEHVRRLGDVLYGFLLGWLAAWWNRWRYSEKRPPQ